MPSNPILRLSNSNQSLDGGLDTQPIDSSLNKNYNALIRERINKEYSCKYAILHSIFLLFFSATMIVAERMQPDNFSMGDFFVISYRTLDGIILLCSSVNIFYALLTFCTGKYVPQKDKFSFYGFEYTP